MAVYGLHYFYGKFPPRHVMGGVANMPDNCYARAGSPSAGGFYMITAADAFHTGAHKL